MLPPVQNNSVGAVLPLFLFSPSFARSGIAVEIIQRLRLFFQVTFAVSLFFWIWALKNTATMDGNVDLGTVSFLTVIISSSYMLGVLNSHSFDAVSKWAKLATTAAHLLVALNYMLGIFVGYQYLNSATFATYCFIFTGIWLGVAYYGAKLMQLPASSPRATISESTPLDS